MQIQILWGLPASGKSTYAYSCLEVRFNRTTKVVNCDSLMNRDNHMSLATKVAKEIEQMAHYYKCIIVDGLVTTNSDANKLMSAIQSLTPNVEFVIVCWNLDREACLHNDRGRRELSAREHIKNMPYETPSEELLTAFGVKLVNKTVERKEDWKVWADENGIYRYELKSYSWSLGGVYGNCWDDTMYTSSSDPQPASFEEFDAFMEKICPSIGFMQYKKLYNACVTVDTSEEYGYYGSHSTSANFSCDVKALYENLKEMGII